MPIIRQYRIFRLDLVENPDVLYVFGDNVERRGLGGQAHSMRGEENAVGIRTKWTPELTAQAFFNDRDYEECIQMIDHDFEPVIDHLEAGGVVVIPLEGLGTGLAKLMQKAPRIYNYLKTKIETLERTYAR